MVLTLSIMALTPQQVPDSSVYPFQRKPVSLQPHSSVLALDIALVSQPQTQLRMLMLS